MSINYGKKGVSEVITTVLLIFITIVAIGLIAYALIPFVKNSLKNSSSCLGMEEKASIVSENSCYNLASQPSEQGTTSVRIRFGDINTTKIFIAVETNANGDTTSYDLEEGKSYTNINNNAIVKLPTPNGGERTYVFNGIASKKAVFGVYNGKSRCVLDEKELLKC